MPDEQHDEGCAGEGGCGSDCSLELRRQASISAQPAEASLGDPDIVLTLHCIDGPKGIVALPRQT
jgi:hypothetical protein